MGEILNNLEKVMAEVKACVKVGESTKPILSSMAKDLEADLAKTREYIETLKTAIADEVQTRADEVAKLTTWAQAALLFEKQSRELADSGLQSNFDARVEELRAHDDQLMANINTIVSGTGGLNELVACAAALSAAIKQTNGELQKENDQRQQMDIYLKSENEARKGAINALREVVEKIWNSQSQVLESNAKAVESQTATNVFIQQLLNRMGVK
jgi:hypothetical protein